MQFDFLCHREGHFAYSDEIESLGGHIYHVPRCNPFDPHYLHEIDRFFENFPYHIVHSHIDCMSAYPLAAAAKHGAVVRVAHSHSSRQDRDIKYPLKIMSKRRIPRVATHLFACGEDAGKWMFNGAPFRVVRNGINVAANAFDRGRRDVTRAALGIDPAAPVIGHVGRFDPVKNHTFLLESFAELRRFRPDAVLLLAGDGPLRTDIEARASALGIGEGVLSLGVRSDIPDLMQAMDVFCMPSLYEGLPLVLVEAQASGLPCLISDTIPADCDIVPGAVARLPLANGYGVWAQGLEELLKTEHPREPAADYVRAAGFEAADTASRLQSFYLTGMWPGGGFA